MSIKVKLFFWSTLEDWINDLNVLEEIKTDTPIDAVKKLIRDIRAGYFKEYPKEEAHT